MLLFNRQFEQWQGERTQMAALSTQRFLYPNSQTTAEKENDPLGALPSVSAFIPDPLQRARSYYCQ